MKFLSRWVCVVFVLITLGADALSLGVLDPRLQQKMNSGQGPFQVVVTFQTLAQINSLNQLGVRFIGLRALAMAGAVLTTSQINQVLGWGATESIYLNDTLSYFNHDAGEMTGAHYVQSSLGYKGTGKTILVLDSGIDATHPDLPFGTKVIQNVKIVSDLGTIGLPTAYIEGVINTDNTSGHGTHVSGTVAGSGAASATDERDSYYYRGVAPEARLVGVGAGEAIVILDALQGFDYAIANKDRYGINVITNSWGNSVSQFDPNNPISKASYEAYSKGIVVTFAAGNEGPGDDTMSTYAINPWVISVAAGTKTGVLADFSSRGEAGTPFEHPDITAPGVDISSTRSPGTPVGAMGPVVNANHPEYTLRYHTISGTSMATPFVAGAVALLLQANGQLSPDQIEEILMATATPMAGYQLFEAGAGYINVRAAVERALSTAGNRTQFLAGDVKWSSQGDFISTEQTDGKILYSGRWETISNSNSSAGSYARGSGSGRRESRKPLFRISFFGTNIKLAYPMDNRGGTAEVFVDGVSKGTINYYSSTQRWNVRSAFGGLANSSHVLEVRGLTGRIYLDKVSVDGRILPANATLVDESETFTGTMGPSVLGMQETRIIPFQVAGNTILIQAEAGWTGGVDIDFYLLDPNGNEVASSASTDNPEALGYWVNQPGIYSYKLVGYATLLANYTVTSTQTRAVTPQGGNRPVMEAPEEVSATDQQPTSFTLLQNYPNPFNPSTVIQYTVPSVAHIQLKVYNLLGQEMLSVVDGIQPPGRYEVEVNAAGLPSGIYLYRLMTEEATLTRRMVLMK